MTALKVTISGSFSRHLADIQLAVSEFEAAGARVLSPSQPTIVDSVDGFVFVASDRHRSPRLVQDRHLASIAQSDLLWLVCPDGYVGQSASLEIGYAVASGIPVWASCLPGDLTLRQYVGLRQSCMEALHGVRQPLHRPDAEPSILVDPTAAADELHRAVSNLKEILTRPKTRTESKNLDKAFEAEHQRASRILVTH
jgi:hypothetical protein